MSFICWLKNWSRNWITKNLNRRYHTFEKTRDINKNSDVEAVHQQVNSYRLRSGKKETKLSVEACEAAHKYAIKLARLNKLSHEDPEDGTYVGNRLKRAGIRWKSCGENLTTAPPQYCVNAWINSPEHQKNLLNSSFREEGLGFAFNGRSWVCCQILFEPDFSILTEFLILFVITNIIILVIPDFRNNLYNSFTIHPEWIINYFVLMIMICAFLTMWMELTKREVVR